MCRTRSTRGLVRAALEDSRCGSPVRIPSSALAPPLHLPITHQEYNRIAHLTYIPSFTDLIDLYYTRNEEKPKTLLKQLTTPSHISVSDNEEFIHPGEGWYEYDTHNPCHYPLVFVNEDREEEVARFIRYHPIGDGITL